MKTYAIISEVEWSFGGDADPNYEYCVENATFKHYEDTEYVLSLGPASDDEYFDMIVEEMKEAGCSQEFIEACRYAKLSGATYILFY